MKFNKWGIVIWLFFALFGLLMDLALGIGWVIGTYIYAVFVVQDDESKPTKHNRD